MSEAKGNGHDATTIEMVELLRALRDDVHGMRDELVKRIDRVEVGLGARIDRVEVGLGARIDQLQEDVLALRADQATMRKELNSLRSELRADLAERDEGLRSVVVRVERLEAAVFKKTG